MTTTENTFLMNEIYIYIYIPKLFSVQVFILLLNFFKQSYFKDLSDYMYTLHTSGLIPHRTKCQQFVFSCTSQLQKTVLCLCFLLTHTDQVHEAVHAVADLKEDVAALPHGLRAER